MPIGTYASPPALVTVEEARVHCLRDGTDDTRDDLLTHAVMSMSKAVARYCGREFFPTDDETRTFSYGGSGYLSLEPKEIRSLTSIRIRYVGYPNWTTLNDAGAVDVMLRPQPATEEGTYLWMMLPEYALPSVYPATLQRGLGIEVEITGDWGMEEIPEDAAMATLLAVDWRYKNPSGSQTVNVGDLGQDSFFAAPSGSAGVPPLPAEAISMLEQFRRTQYGV